MLKGSEKDKNRNWLNIKLLKNRYVAYNQRPPTDKSKLIINHERTGAFKVTTFKETMDNDTYNTDKSEQVVTLLSCNQIH